MHERAGPAWLWAKGMSSGGVELELFTVPAFLLNSRQGCFVININFWIRRMGRYMQETVFWIQISLYWTGAGSAPDPDHSINKQKNKKNLDFCCLV